MRDNKFDLTRFTYFTFILLKMQGSWPREKEKLIRTPMIFVLTWPNVSRKDWSFRQGKTIPNTTRMFNYHDRFALAFRRLYASTSWKNFTAFRWITVHVSISIITIYSDIQELHSWFVSEHTYILSTFSSILVWLIKKSPTQIASSFIYDIRYTCIKTILLLKKYLS